jgi:hypothetical protein
MRPVALALCVLVAEARADEPIGIEGSTEGETPSNEVPPLLRFESGLEVSLESIAEKITRLELGPDAEVHLRGTWREVSDERRRDYDRVRQWSAGAGGSYDFGWARLSAGIAYRHDENELGSADSVETDIRLTKTFRLTDDVTGFVGLWLGRRHWLRNKPLPGEASSTQLTLSAGLRWR